MGDKRSHPGFGVAAVGDDTLDEGKAPPGLSQQRFGTGAILDVGGMDVEV